MCGTVVLVLLTNVRFSCRCCDFSNNFRILPKVSICVDFSSSDFPRDRFLWVKSSLAGEISSSLDCHFLSYLSDARTIRERRNNDDNWSNRLLGKGYLAGKTAEAAEDTSWKTIGRLVYKNKRVRSVVVVDLEQNSSVRVSSSKFHIYRDKIPVI